MGETMRKILRIRLPTAGKFVGYVSTRIANMVANIPVTMIARLIFRYAFERLEDAPLNCAYRVQAVIKIGAACCDWFSILVSPMVLVCICGQVGADGAVFFFKKQGFPFVFAKIVNQMRAGGFKQIIAGYKLSGLHIP